MLFDWQSFEVKDRLRRLSAKDAAAAHVAVDKAFARSLESCSLDRSAADEGVRHEPDVRMAGVLRQVSRLATGSSSIYKQCHRLVVSLGGNQKGPDRPLLHCILCNQITNPCPAISRMIPDNPGFSQPMVRVYRRADHLHRGRGGIPLPPPPGYSNQRKFTSVYPVFRCTGYVFPERATNVALSKKCTKVVEYPATVSVKERCRCTPKTIKIVARHLHLP